MTYHKRRINKQEYTAAMSVIPPKEEIQLHSYRITNKGDTNLYIVKAPHRSEVDMSQPALVPTNNVPAAANSLVQIKREAQERSGLISFLNPEARRFWAKTREQFYVIEAEFQPDGKYGEGWVLTFQPLEGPLCRMSFTNTGSGTRDEVVAMIAEQLPVGPCVLTYQELSNGYEFFNLEPA